VNGTLPDGSYLASLFRDPHREREVRRVYYEDGRVMAFDGTQWWQVCTFTPEQVGRAKEAVRRSGLPEAQDISDEQAFDVAQVTYAWQLGDESGQVTSGQVTNWAYPARQHPVFEALDEQLDVLETEAGAEWST